MHFQKNVKVLSIFCASLIPALYACSLDEACREGVEYKNGNKCETCAVGFHINKTLNGCEPNTITDCGTGHKNCTEMPNTKEVVCNESGLCEIKKCDTDNGYNYNTGLNQCVYGTPCQDVNDCLKTANAREVKCSSGACVISCEEGYHLSSDQDACRENIIMACQDVSDCKNSITGVALANCMNHECQILTCEDGFHTNELKSLCEVDTNKACGGLEEEFDCTKIENAKSTECEPDDDGKSHCVVKTCKTGFYPSEDGSECVGNCPDNQWLEEINACMECASEAVNVSLSATNKLYGSSHTCLKGSIDVTSDGSSGTSASFYDLKYVKGDIVIDNVDNVIFSKLEYVNKLSLNKNIESDFSALKKIGDGLSLTELNTDKTFSFPKLEQVTETMNIESNSVTLELAKILNANITTHLNQKLSVSNLEVLNGNLFLYETDGDIRFTNLSKIDGNLTLRKNATFHLDNLEIVTGKLHPSGSCYCNWKTSPYYDEGCYREPSIGCNDTSLTQLFLPKLKSVNQLIVDKNPVFKKIDLPMLEEVNELKLDGSYSIADHEDYSKKCTDVAFKQTNNNVLKDISFPALRKAKSITIEDFAALKSIQMPELSELESLTITCPDNAAMTTINMPKLPDGVEVYINIEKCKNLTECHLGQKACPEKP